MKIRNGFVSNSSSSSFCLIVADELHEKALESLGHPYFKKVTDAMHLEHTRELFGKEVRSTVWWEGNINTFEWLDVPSDDLPEQAGYDETHDETDWEAEYGSNEYGAFEEYRAAIRRLDPKGELYFFTVNHD